jgi:Tfp pilus assembly protein PilF
MFPLVALLALLGCVTSDGHKPIKQEDPKVAAAKINIQLGTTYLQQGNFVLAREKLERSLKQNPKDPDVHTSLGLLYDRTGDAKLADKHFRTIQDLDRAVAERCVTLDAAPDLYKGRVDFHWWPKPIKLA